jgi:hypothetical protein
MSKLDDQVLAVYDAIFSLPANEQIAALNAWWKSLEESCTPDNPCIECQRELEAQLREGGG